MKAILKSIIVAVGCAGAMRFAAYRRFGTWVLRVAEGAEA